jgi:hypothetical protein
MLLTGPPENPHLYGVWCDGWHDSTKSFLLYLIETTQRTIYSSTISVMSMPKSRIGHQSDDMYIQSLTEVSKTYSSSEAFTFKVDIREGQIHLTCRHNNLILFTCIWPHGYNDNMSSLFQQYFVASYKVNSVLQASVCEYQQMITTAHVDLKKATEDMDKLVQEKDAGLNELMKKFTIILNAKKHVINELRSQIAKLSDQSMWKERTLLLLFLIILCHNGCTNTDISSLLRLPIPLFLNFGI